jgi:hypothetical protein
MNPADSNSLFLGIENNNFFKNNEYFNNLQEGYTLIGYYVTPSLIYYPSGKTRISAGIHLLKYSGVDSYTKVLPYFRIDQKLLPFLILTMGSLDASLNHGYIEPLYAFERVFTQHIENGIQFKLNTSHIKSDVWLNWENFIFQDDPHQEKLTQGTSTSFILNSPESLLTVTLPVQTVITHRGGQINSIKAPLESLANLSTGLILNFNTNHTFIKAIKAESYIAQYIDLSPTKQHPYTRGFGIYPLLTLVTPFIDLSAGYWYAQKFIATRGGDVLFSCQSINNPAYYQNERKLVTGKLSIKKEYKSGISLAARFEPYYDLQSSHLDYSYSLYLLFNGKFFLSKLKF